MLKMFRFTWIIVVLVCLYLAWVFYSRWSDNRAYLGRLEGRKAAQDRAVVDAYGGNRLTIVGFYATPATIRRGDTARLCYSVSNSKSVRIEPPIENVRPSLSRCVEVTPQSNTVYKLVAEDADGHTKTAGVAVKVR